MENFENKVTINNKTFRELRRHLHLKRPSEKLMVVAGTVACFSIAIADMINQNVTFAIIGFLIGIAIPVVYIVRFNLSIKKSLMRTQEGAKEFEYIVSFMDDKLKLDDVNTEGTTYCSYDDINRLIPTKNMYMLFTINEQVIIVNKTSLLQEQKNEAFMCFIKDKCKNISW